MLPGSPTGHRPGSSVLEGALVRFSDEAAVGPVAFPDGRQHLRDGCGTLGPVAAFDATRPNTARMYDYWLGGKDNISQELLDCPHSVRTDAIQACHAHYSKTAVLSVRDVSGTYMGVMSEFLGGRS